MCCVTCTVEIMSQTERSFLARILPDPTLAPRIVKLATPIIFAMLTQTFINIMDTLFVGKLDPSFSIPGQAALNYSLPLLWIVGGSLSAVGVGTQAITARRFGEKKSEDAGQVLTNSLAISVVLGIIFSIGAYLACPWLFGFLTNNESVLALGVPYAQIRFLGVLSMAVTMSYKSFFDGIGRTHIHMVAAMVMNLLNLVLNYCLIFGAWIFPELKVEGAAWASLISTYVGLLIMILWTFPPKIRSVYNYYHLAKVNLKVVWEIARLSVPSGMATIFVMLGILMFIKIIGLLDEAAIAEGLAQTGIYTGDVSARYAAHQTQMLMHPEIPGTAMVGDWSFAMLQNRPAIFTAAAKVVFDVMSICFISSLAFGTATATLVSQSLGEGKPDLAPRYGWDSIKIYAGIMAILGVLISIFPEVALDLISDDEVVIQAGAQGMRIQALLMPFIAVGLICTQALFGAGNSKFVMYVEMILHFTCLVPLAYLLSSVLELGFLGVWLASVVYIVLLALVMGWKFWEGKWKDIKV